MFAAVESSYRASAKNNTDFPGSHKLLGKFNKSVSLLTWGYNEESLTEAFLDRAVALLDANVNDWEIVFVNDGSTDRTGRILGAYAAKEPRIRPIHHECNLNVGRACKRAIAEASKEYLLWQTVDWSYDIRNIRIFLELLSYYDVVQGVRPTPIRLLSSIPFIRSIYRVNKRSDNFRKAVISLSNYYIIRVLFGLKFYDFQNVTIYPTRLVQSVPLASSSSFLNPECLLRTYAQGATFIEVPIPFIARTVGSAKGTKLKSILRSIRDIAISWLEWGWNYQSTLKSHPQCNRIQRVSDPSQLDNRVAGLVAPLFQDFR